MVFIVIGAVLIGIAVLLAVLRTKKNDQLLEIRSTKTSTAADLTELQQSIFASVGPGGFSQLSEVVGTVESNDPLTSDLAEIPSVWYRSRVEERYEEDYVERDSNGNERRGTRTATETVQRSEESRPFTIRDETGTILVDPSDAKIEAETVMEKHEPYHGDGGIRIGPFSINPTSGRRIIGYTYHEEALRVGAKAYVIGDACDRQNGELCVRKPTDKTKPFIISTRSEEEIVAGMQKSASVKFVIGIVLAVLGAVSVVYGIVGK